MVGNERTCRRMFWLMTALLHCGAAVTNDIKGIPLTSTAWEDSIATMATTTLGSTASVSPRQSAFASDDAASSQSVFGSPSMKLDLCVPATPRALTPMFNLGAGSSGGGQTTFFCPKCRQNMPISESISKGTQLWCVKDNSSYNGLAARWAKERRLKAWWNALSADEQCAWFRKWQAVGSKKRFDEIDYTEKSSAAVMVDADDVDHWKPWAVFLRDGVMLGKTPQQLEMEFKDIVDANRAECLFRRGQWLVPEYLGFERRVRQRQSQEIECARRAQVTDAAHLQQLVGQGQLTLDRFRQGVHQPTMAPTLPAPHVESSEADQAVLPIANDIVMGNIGREITAQSREAACTRSLEHDDALAASTGVSTMSNTEPCAASIANKSVGIEKTRTGNAANVLATKVSELVAKIEREAEDIDKRMTDLFKAGNDMSGGPQEMKVDIGEKRDLALKFLNEQMSATVVSLKKRASDATDVGACLIVQSEISQAFKNVASGPVKDYTAVHGRTARFLSRTERQEARRARKDAHQVGTSADVDGAEAPQAPCYVISLQLADAGVSTGKSVYEAKGGVTAATIVSTDDIVGELIGNAMIKKAVKTVQMHMKNAGVTASYVKLDEVPKMKKIQKIMKKGFPSDVFTQMPLPNEAWAQRIGQPEFFGSYKGHLAVLTSHFCCIEARLVLQGEYVILGVPYEKCPGVTFADKRTSVLRATFEDLKGMVADGGFVLKPSAADGNLVLLPSGFVIVSCSVAAFTTSLRWCVSADENDKQRVLFMLGKTMESFTDLRNQTSGFPQLQSYLSA